MNVSQARSELRKMDKRRIFRLVSDQRISGCLVGGRSCGLYLHYKGFNFCLSEIMGEGCHVERSAKLEEEVYQWKKETHWSLPLLDRIGIISLPPEKKAVEFKVYCRDHITHSTTLIGRVIERRTKERGNNLRDLLVKALKDYSDCAAAPSTIFLLGP